MRSLPVATKPMMTVSFQSLSTLTTANDRASWSPERSNNQLKWDRGGRRVKRAISESWGALTGDRTLTIRIITNVIAPTIVLKSASNRKKWKAQSFWLNYDSWFGALEVASSKSTRALIGESWGTDDYVITSEKKNVWKAKPKKSENEPMRPPLSLVISFPAPLSFLFNSTQDLRREKSADSTASLSSLLIFQTPSKH